MKIHKRILILLEREMNNPPQDESEGWRRNISRIKAFLDALVGFEGDPIELSDEDRVDLVRRVKVMKTRIPSALSSNFRRYFTKAIEENS